MEAWQVVRRFAPYARIVHHIPGRIRLKFVGGGELAERIPDIPAERLRGALASIPGVKSVKINLLARSCTLEYDPSVIAHEAFPDLLGGRETPAAEALLDALRAKYAEISRK
jgi:hypothetical protein